MDQPQGKQQHMMGVVSMKTVMAKKQQPEVGDEISKGISIICGQSINIS